MTAPSTVYRRSDNVVSRRILDEVVLVPIYQELADDQAIFTLNEIGARIWDLVDGRRTVEEIRRTLLEEYDVGPERLDADLSRVFAQLLEIGALGEGDGDAPSIPG
ncbi:MAG: PqqD family protein [Planctomycetes bacterium]|nr:PqqD family protein [Planctomycetota bacterium]